MKYLIILLTLLSILSYPINSDAASKDVTFKGKPAKPVVLKDRAGRKKICKEYIVKERISGKMKKRKIVICE